MSDDATFQVDIDIVDPEHLTIKFHNVEIERLDALFTDHVLDQLLNALEGKAAELGLK